MNGSGLGTRSPKFIWKERDGETTMTQPFNGNDQMLGQYTGASEIYLYWSSRGQTTGARPPSEIPTYKTDRYTPLKNRLAGHLAGWTVGILTFTIGIRGSYDPDRWYANLTCFGLTATQTDYLMRDLVAQTLKELTDLYSVRYAALQQHHTAPNA